MTGGNGCEPGERGGAEALPGCRLCGRRRGSSCPATFRSRSARLGRPGEPAALTAPAPDRPHAGRCGVAVSRVKNCCYNGMGGSAGGKLALRPSSHGRPGVGPGKPARWPCPQRAQVGLERLAASGGEAAVRGPQLLQRGDDVPTAAAGQELDRRMVFAKPDGHAVAELDALGRAARPIDADGADRPLRPDVSSLVERRGGHASRMAGRVSAVGVESCRDRFRPQMTFIETAKWPPQTNHRHARRIPAPAPPFRRATADDLHGQARNDTLHRHLNPRELRGPDLFRPRAGRGWRAFGAGLRPSSPAVPSRGSRVPG
jgi:hypothetical protein